MRLLIVEDDLKINKAVSKGLSEEGFELDSAFDGDQALGFIEKKVYDCIVLDLMIPGTDGMGVLRTIRRAKDLTPIIILTAKDSVEDKVEGLDRGADDYLAKPFSFNELLSRIKAVIRRNTSGGSILQADNLILDPFKHTVKRKGITIELTSKDFSLLECLMKRKGAVVSEDQIIRYVWDYDEEIVSNVVASHIKNLRSRIDKAFPEEKPIIHTLRGLGYKIDG